VRSIKDVRSDGNSDGKGVSFSSISSRASSTFFESEKIRDYTKQKDRTDLHQTFDPFLREVHLSSRGILLCIVSRHNQVLMINRRRTEVNCINTCQELLTNKNNRGSSPRTKLQTQKNPCMGYNLHSIVSCRYGVTSPTIQLNNQFVEVESETPFALIGRGMILIQAASQYLTTSQSY